MICAFDVFTRGKADAFNLAYANAAILQWCADIQTADRVFKVGFNIYFLLPQDTGAEKDYAANYQDISR